MWKVRTENPASEQARLGQADETTKCFDSRPRHYHEALAEIVREGHHD